MCLSDLETNCGADAAIVPSRTGQAPQAVTARDKHCGACPEGGPARLGLDNSNDQAKIPGISGDIPPSSVYGKSALPDL